MTRTASASLTIALVIILTVVGLAATIRLVGRVPLPLTYLSVAGLAVFAVLVAACWRHRRWGFYGVMVMAVLVLGVNFTTPTHNVFILRWADPVDSTLLLLTGYVLPVLLVAFSTLSLTSRPRETDTQHNRERMTPSVTR